MRLGRWAIVCAVAIFALAMGPVWAACGDGVIQAGEECDDGSSQNGGTNSCCQTNCLLSGKSPDVIVGDLYNQQRYGNEGGITAYAVGTISCNLGSCWLNWISGTAEHPVIGQNMFRLKDGRFEQIGQSWLKHGFTALTGSVCATCVAPPNGSHLGVNCSDPYDASLNGQQNRLGPKENVNPSTGVYLYPDSRIGLTSTSVIYKRLQVHDTDLNFANPNATTQYFVEGQYVTHDDAAAKNQTNNASYRTVTVGAAPSFSLTLTGSTQRQKAGIEAWKATDPTVTQTAISAPDGKFILAAKVTSLGGGQYHYEYAVQNLNNERAGQSFTVPIQPGTTITNVGFHDVDYHSGEPFLGTDWTPSVTATSVRWETLTYATNVNANALRWGTLYNFRFDANVAPGSSNIAIDLFKPGGTASPVTAALPVPGPCFGAADGGACNDLNACTQTDTCVSGGCVGSNPVSCSASDQCHNAGTCQAATGTCTNPAKTDGTPCADGNACTQTDACVSGSCLGSNPVTCTAADQCHDAGTCQAATGTCSTGSSKADGTPCSDGDLCTQTDACTSGACFGSNPVSCFASDQCHDVGTCQAATGTCTNPAKPDGASCNDANTCTANDACSSGVCTGVGPQVPQDVGDGVALAQANGLTTISWTAATGSTYSSVLRGLVSQFPVGPGGADEYCLEISTLGTTTTDSQDPDDGEGFWYLVRGVNDCGGGSYGSDWQNGFATPRQSTTCP